jgi:DNA-binding NarL/FixJ family response regulator
MMSARVLICDDHAIVRSGLRTILSASGDIEVVGEAGDYGQLRAQLRALPCDVLLLDIEMPGKNGIDALATIRKDFPKLGVLMLSIYPEDQYAVRAIKSGAAGYLNKNSAPERLVEAVRTVATGRRFFSPEVSEALAQTVSGDAREAQHERLSDREFEVMKMIAAGKRLSEIAEALALSPKTVSVYRARLLEKMGLANNVDVARYAVRHGLV